MAARRGFGLVRKLPSGRWQASYVAPTGSRVTAPSTYGARVDAEGWLADERRYLERVGPDSWKPERQRGEQLDPRTLREYSVDWLRRPRIRATTREKYAQALRLRVLPTLGDVPVVQLSRAQVGSWWRGLDHDKHPRACDLAYQALRTMMGAAVDEELIAANPCQVRGAGGASKRRSLQPLTPAQVQACADAMPAAWSVGVLLGAWCALRSGEIRELRRRDIDLKATPPVIHVRRAVVRAEGRLQVGDTKTGAGVRDVPIPAPLVEPLRLHLRDHTQLGRDGLLIWAPIAGGSVHDGTWRQAWVAAAKAAGVEGYRFHDLRHTGLTYAAMAGATVRELQRMAGHTTAAMAMRYQEVADPHLAEVVDRLGALIQPPAVG